MQFPEHRRFVAICALALLIAAPHSSTATPLSGAAEMVGSEPARPLNETEIAGAGLMRPESGILTPSMVESAVLQSSQAASTGSGNQDPSASVLRYGTSADSPLDIFRGLVYAPQGANPRQTASRPNLAADADLLSPEAREWIDDAVRGIVNSAVDLRINEQGRTSFSVLGMGDFGIMMSSDRNELALVNGDDVLLTAPRSQAGVGRGQSGFDVQTAGPYAGGQGGASSDRSLQQALELAREIATHPLSILVYAIVGAFILVWNIVGFSTRRSSATRPLNRHRSHRSHHA